MAHHTTEQIWTNAEEWHTLSSFKHSTPYNPYSLTVQSTPYSLTKTMFTRGHACNFPSILPSVHHSSYIIHIILLYDHISLGRIYVKARNVLLQLSFLALRLYINHEHVLGVGVCVHAYKTRLSSIFVCIHRG